MVLDDLIKGAKGVEHATNRLPVIRKGRSMFFRKSELERAFSSDSATSE